MLIKVPGVETTVRLDVWELAEDRRAGSVFHYFYNISRMCSLERPPSNLIVSLMHQQNVYYSSVP